MEVATLQVEADAGIVAVVLTLDADDIEFSPLPHEVPPGDFDDNGGMHEFILEFCQ